MTPSLIFISFLIYTLILFAVSFISSRNSNEDSFFDGNRKSPWYIVAYGMIGASLSGVTFISVPGAVAGGGFSYLVMVFGYFIGYLVIINVLLPLYYKLKLISIYSYLEDRFGWQTYKSGAIYFLISRIIGASFRMFLIINVLQLFVFDAWNVPFYVTVGFFILLILIYTMKAGIKTIVWTDTLQTTFMLAAVILTLYYIAQFMDLSASGLFEKVWDSKYSKIWVSDWNHPRFFLKQFVAGIFMSIVMTGMDQDMMQKNLSCKNTKEAQKNMFWMSLSLIPINLVFLILGGALVLYANQLGLIIPDKADALFPLIAFEHLNPIAGIVFIIGLIAAAYSSADSALTSLTTSFSIDILNIKSEKFRHKNTKLIRQLVHVGIAVLLFFVIILFRALNDDSVVNELFTAAGYTYGPLLGLFSFGLFTQRKINDKMVFMVVLLAPILTYILGANSENWFNGYVFGFELLIINGFFTFLGLWAISYRKV